ncbi:hypothetical protein NHF46_21550 [Arthrobacter alpinus]|nr:hypothetical protein [Arthrobacter alpinus]
MDKLPACRNRVNAVAASSDLSWSIMNANVDPPEPPQPTTKNFRILACPS